MKESKRSPNPLISRPGEPSLMNEPLTPTLLPRAFFYFILLTVGLAIILIAIGPRSIIYPDAMEYADIARGVARGDGLRDRAVWLYQLSFSDAVPAPAVRRAIGFPLVEAAAFKLLGASDLVAHGVSVFFFVLAVLASFGLGATLSPTRSRAWILALATGLLVLFDPHSLLFAVSGLAETFFMFALVVVAWLIVRPPAPGKWFVIGLLVGLSQMIRLNGFTLIPPCLLAAFLIDRPGFKKNALQLIAGCSIPLLLIAIRNFLTIGMFSFIGTNGAILYNELGGLTQHGIEHKLYLPPAKPPDLRWILSGHLSDLGAKIWRGLNGNLTSALTAVSPLAWGACALHVATAWTRLSPRIRALAAFALSTAMLWVCLFSLGEFEGPRFFVPLAPLVILLAVRGFYDQSIASVLSKTARWTSLTVLGALLLIPGFYRLSEILGPDDGVTFRQQLGEVIARTTPNNTSTVIMSDIPWAVAWYGDRSAVLIPFKVGDVEAVRRRASATFLLLSNSVLSNGEIENQWKELFSGGRDHPARWSYLSSGPLEGSIVLYELDRTAPDSGALLEINRQGFSAPRDGEAAP